MNKKKSLILLDYVTDINLENIEDCEIISLDYITHKTLLSKNIQHTLSEKYISKDERNNLFDFIISCNEWYKKIPSSKNLIIENINLLSLLNQQEFHMEFIELFIKIFTISNIIKNEKPEKIFISSNLKNYVEQFIDKKLITIIHSNIDLKKDSTDKIEIRFNLFSKPIAIYPSRKLYTTFKNLQEDIICSIFNLWYKPNSKKSNLILEFNPDLFSALFSELKSSKNQTLLINHRRSAVWDWKSIQVLRRNNCKIIKLKDFLWIEKKDFEYLRKNYSHKLKLFFENNQELEKYFSFGGVKFWPIIKEKLENIFTRRMDSYLKYILSTKNILNTINLNAILSLYEHGETENTFRVINERRIPTVLLQHYFFKYDDKHFDVLWRYENESMYGLNSSYLLLWGPADFNYYKRFGISEKKIFVTGSPKHDNYYPTPSDSSQTTILLAVMPISNLSGLCSTTTQIEYENMLGKILQTLKSIKNIRIIIKLHPGDNYSNTLLNKYFKLNHSELLVLQSTPSKKLIESCDVLIHTGPELYEVSTIILEGMLLGKPVIDVSLDEKIKNVNPLENGLVRLSVKDDLTQISNLLNDNSKLRVSTSDELQRYISNHHTASKQIREFLDNIEK